MEVTPEQIEALNMEPGFNRSFLVQYADWLMGIFRGDWGESYFLHQSVLEAIAEYFMPTLSLAILAQLFALLLSVPLGILAAYRRGTVLDIASVSISLLGVALPGFLLSMFLMLFFGVYHQWFPVAGYAGLSEGIGEHLCNVPIYSEAKGLRYGSTVRGGNNFAKIGENLDDERYPRSMSAKIQKESFDLLILSGFLHTSIRLRIIFKIASNCKVQRSTGLLSDLNYYSRFK